MTEAVKTVSGVQKVDGGLNYYLLNMRGTEVSFGACIAMALVVMRGPAGGCRHARKIEFLKGPTDFMTGATDPGGVVNIVTKQPTKEAVANLNGGFGSFNVLRFTAILVDP
jgi:iron complex outermembrane receptor protein